LSPSFVLVQLLDILLLQIIDGFQAFFGWQLLAKLTFSFVTYCIHYPESFKQILIRAGSANRSAVTLLNNIIQSKSTMCGWRQNR